MSPAGNLITSWSSCSIVPNRLLCTFIASIEWTRAAENGLRCEVISRACASSRTTRLPSRKASTRDHRQTIRANPWELDDEHRAAGAPVGVGDVAAVCARDCFAEREAETRVK